MANQQDEDEFNSEAIRALAEKCDLLVNQVVIGEISQDTFYSRLRETGISPEAATDYTEMMIQRVQSRGHHIPPRQLDPQTPPGSRPSSPFRNRASTPEGLEGDDLLDFRRRRDALLQAQQGPRDNALSQQEVADAVAWATLRAKIGQLRPPDISLPSTNRSAAQFAESLSTLFRDSHASDSAAVVAPHLARIAGGARNDVHLKKTREIRVLFKSDSFRDSTITNAQLAPLNEPLPRSIWKKIVLEEFVDFTKLFASMDQGYNHYDEPEDFAAGFAIIKKNHLSAKRDVVSEADWIRVFDAWKDGVLLIFPHRATELQGYRRFVMDIFRSTPLNPAAAIRFDRDARDRYAKQPFHMDDRSLLHLPLLTELFAAANSSSVSSSTSLKRPRSSSTTTTPSKRSDVPCRNWNWGNCEDPCSNRRKHGCCCICGEEHQAKENAACLAKLQNRALENIP
jgi:hypothetical protein